MDEITLRVEVIGENSIDEELTAFLKQTINPAVTKALDSVGVDMAGALKRHIQTDVYDAYTPKVYERRSEHPGAGTPLDDMNANALTYNHGSSLTFAYKPTGEHSNPTWHSVDGDDLIGRIEKHDPEYRWLPKNGTLPNRPFWQNFVNEMIDQKEMEYYFVAAMIMQGITDITADGDLTRESGDGQY